MIDVVDMQAVWKLIKDKSEETALYDCEDSCIHDACGGNFDDAYSIGIEDGEIGFAREILARLEAKD